MPLRKHELISVEKRVHNRCAAALCEVWGVDYFSYGLDVGCGRDESMPAVWKDIGAWAANCIDFGVIITSDY